VSVNKFELADATVMPTTGLVPYRRRRGKRPGGPPTEDIAEAERWAQSQPWFPRVRLRRSDARWFTWWTEPLACPVCANPVTRPGAELCSRACGNMVRGAKLRIPIVERIQKHIDIDHGGRGCWLWCGGLDSRGYGQLGVDGVTLRAHRVAYEAYVGPIPEGLELDHLCRERRCVNPDHLEPVTRSVNVRRGLAPEVNAARNLAKTHCPHGHPYEGDNVRVHPNGGRSCRTCDRIGRPSRRAQ